jgi:hypothetical protein
MPAAEKLRVVVTGHTGLAKDEVLARFCEFVAKQTGKQARFYSAEGEIDPASFLDEHWKKQLGDWRNSLIHALNKCDQDDPDFAFLSLHLSYQRFGRVFSPLSWYYDYSRKTGTRVLEHTVVELLKERFKPDYCVNLIDDVMAVQARIARGYHFRLAELIKWRNLETVLTDHLAGQVVPRRIRLVDPGHRVFERSPVVSIRHPRSMLYKYLVHADDIPRVYISYPIGGPRANPDYVKELNLFRSKMHEHFTVFDPVTIDEKPLESLVAPDLPLFAKPGTDRVKFRASSRWNLDADDTLVGKEYTDVDGISREEVREIVEQQRTDRAPVSSVMEYQIEDRDFRLIEQSDFVVFYRPQYGARDTFSSGTGEEWRYSRAHGIPRLIIHDRDVDGTFNPRQFRIRPGESPHLVNDFGGLSNVDNQTKAVNEVIERIKKSFGQAA